jgi:hypothetical protein
VLERIVESGRLREMACKVLRARAFFRRHPGVARVLSSGGALHPDVRTVVETGQSMGVRADEMMHGMRFARFPYDTLCGDAYTVPSLDRLLAWGPQNRDWLTAIEAPIGCVITGHPGYAALSPPLPFVPESHTRILFLPSPYEEEDYTVHSADCHEHMVGTLKLFERLGFRDVVIKLHPGIRNPELYREILTYCGVSGNLAWGGGFHTHLREADLVIGPVWSSALLETLAAGKPYIPILLPRTLVDRRLLGPIPVIETTEELREALTDGWAPDWDTALRFLLGHGEIGDPATRVWRALADDRCGTTEQWRARTPDV